MIPQMPQLTQPITETARCDDGQDDNTAPRPERPRPVSRRVALQHAAVATTGAFVVGAIGAIGARSRGLMQTGAATDTTATTAPDRTSGGTSLQPHDAIASILAALDRFPLVALGERHLLQEMHDVLTSLLRHPALPGKITDIVVEFGNALHQDLADRFVLGDQSVSRADLAQLWRFTIGGNVLWDAPVYEQFFRTVRAVNWTLPPTRRIRVLLGDPPFDHRKVRSTADKGYIRVMTEQRDAYYAGVVEREVLRKGRRALLIAGANHLLRGIHDHSTPPRPNAASLLAQRHPGALYVTDVLVLPPGPQIDPLVQRTAAMVAHWPRPSLATLAGTWLGNTTQSAEPWINSAAYLAATSASRRYGAQADAVLYLGPGAVLTASRPDPTIYQYGAYRAELQRLSRIVSQIEGQSVDLVADGLRLALGGPSWFATNGPAPAK